MDTMAQPGPLLLRGHGTRGAGAKCSEEPGPVWRAGDGCLESPGFSLSLRRRRGAQVRSLGWSAEGAPGTDLRLQPVVS